MSRLLVVVWLCAVVVVLGVPMDVSAQSQPSAAELYEQGESLFESGEYAQARQTLRRADPFQLSREARLKYYKMMAAISREVGQNGGGPVQEIAPSATNEDLQNARDQQRENQQAMQQGVAGVQEIQQLPEMQPVAGVADEPYGQGPTSNNPAKPSANASSPNASSNAQPVSSSDVLARNRKMHAQQKIDEAQQAMANDQPALAVRLYEQALAFDPDNDQIRQQRDQAQAQLSQQGDTGNADNAQNAPTAGRPNLSPTAGQVAAGGDTAPSNTLQRNIEDMQLEEQAALAEFNAEMAEARRLLDEDDYALARNAAERARQIIDRQRSRLFSPSEEQNLRGQAEQLIAQIDADAEAAEAERVEEARVQQEEETRKAREQAMAEQTREINELLRRAMELKRQRNYEEALELVEQVLFLDPDNVAGEILRDTIVNDNLYNRTRQLLRERAVESAREQMDTIQETTMQQELITYPPDWPELTRRRLLGLDATGGESEANRRVAIRLREPIPVDFEANQLQSVIAFLRNTTGLNFFVNWAALEQAGVEQDAPVTLTLQNVPAEQVLRLVLQQVSTGDLDPIGFSVIDGIVTVSTVRDLQRQTEIRTYDIRDLLVQVPNFSEAPAFDLTSVLGEGGESSGGSSGSLFGDDTDEISDEEQEQLLTEIQELIRDSVGDPLEWADRGGDVSSLRELNGNLIVKTTPQNHRQIIKLLGQLRETRAVQISVEARFLAVTQNFLEEIGVDLDAYIQGNANSAIGEIGGSVDTGTGSVDTSTPVSFVQDSIGLASRGNGQLTGTSGRWNTLDAMDFGMAWSPWFLDSLALNLVVKATQANRDVISLTAPRVTFFNGQRAYVLVATQQAFVSDLEPIPDSLSFDPTLSVVQSGAVLDVQGTISSDRRYVTMTLRPSLATVNEIREIPIPLGLEGDILVDGSGSVDLEIPTANIEAPELELTQVRATVSVPDRGTIVLGGQKLVDEVEYEAGVPVLSKIPVLSRFFTNTSTVRDERTLLILVQPEIIIQSELEEDLFPGLEADPAAYNVGGFGQQQ